MGLVSHAKQNDEWIIDRQIATYFQGKSNTQATRNDLMIMCIAIFTILIHYEYIFILA